ncbi:enoyl-CoA hydratase [Bacillus smithii]|uniref:enoyl-CoA hydratase/isomerase family protein n=1 Tax=Bacillus smithii TaxID=1479 RepID=UPI002E1BE584|nr:enoyl-CoA hydratase [Bacillus smithii]
MSDVLVEKQGKILILTLNRPESLNAFSEDMLIGLREQLQQAGEDDSVKAIVIRGSGRAFSAGGDVKSMANRTDIASVYDLVGHLNQCILTVQEVEKPIVAAVHGYAAGAGFNLALASDFILASDESKFILSFAQVGLISDGGGLHFLPKILGPHKVKELFFLAEPIPAKEALALGIINRVVPIEELQDEVISFAVRLSQGPLKAYGKMKKLINESYQLTLEQLLERERLTQMLMAETEDHKEGVTAFNEKRTPVFRGK